MEKFIAALPRERSECAILPPATPLVGSPARRRNEFAFPVITGTPRSDPHSTAKPAGKDAVREIEGEGYL